MKDTKAQKPRRTFWRKPALRRDEDSSMHRPVTWLELFLDVFFVVAVAGLSHQLAHHVSWSEAGAFVAQFLPLAWLWVGVTYYMERFETESVENRLILFCFMLVVGGMAVFSHDGLGENYAGYVLCFVAGRAFTTFLWLRAGYHDKHFRPVARIYGVGFSLAITCQVLSTFLDGSSRLVLFGVGLLIDAVTPLVAIPPTRALPSVSTSKHPERFGLFMILVLGETAVGVTTGLAGPDSVTVKQASGAALGVLLGFSMWSVYFDFIARRPFRQGPWYLYGWTYLHLVLYVSVVCVGAAILNGTQFEGGVLPAAVRVLVTGALGSFLVCVGLLECLLKRRRDEPTHALLSPAMKLVCGFLLPFVALIETDKFTFFACFYPFLLVHIVYGHTTWFRQKLPASDLEDVLEG
jgi:low temperature requirement protein LtrA